MVYGVVAVLSLSGSSGRQYQAHPVGRNSSYNHSSGNWLGDLESYWKPPGSLVFYRYFSRVYLRVRVHDSSPGVRRVIKRAAAPRPVARLAVQPPPAYTGNYSCSMLESLWIQQGGNPGEAFIAAEIARAESGGNPGAISPTADYGLWQINVSNGAYATLDPVGNARAAIAISNDGTNWSPWTTYTSGAYVGRCL